MDTGQALKAFRTAKHIKMTDIADNVVSQSLLSRVERGETDISLNRFNHLLQQLHVTPTEYFAAVNSAAPAADPEDCYLGYFPQFLLDTETVQNKTRLTARLTVAQSLAAQTKAEYTSHPSQWRLITWRAAELFVNRITAHLDPTQVVPVDSTPAQSYLLNLEHWSLMDVILFSYFADQFTPTIKLRLLQALLHHIPNIGLVQSWASLLTDIVFGLFQQFMVASQLVHAQITLTIMGQLEKRFNQTDDAILLLFMQGWLTYVQAKINQPAGKLQMDDAISILSILNYPQTAKKYRQLADRITGIDSTPIVGDITFNH